MHPDTSLEDQKEFFRRNKSIIENFKGNIQSLETWGKRILTNPIGKSKRGIYFHAMFEARPAAVPELERTMRINDKVLRFLHTKLDARVPLSKHLENFRKSLAETAQREKEREAKIAAKRAAAAAAGGDRFERGFDRGDRPDRGERGFGGDRPERGFDRGDRPDKPDRGS
jgi:small subunit ribosomal protein S6